MDHDTRPVNLDLTKFSFPVAALASVTHRIAGMVLFVGIAFLLFALDKSLASETEFNEIRELMQNPIARIVILGLVSGLIYHFVAGIKHLLLDLEIGDTLEGGTLAARMVFVISIILILLAAVWIFQ